MDLKRAGVSTLRASGERNEFTLFCSDGSRSIMTDNAREPPPNAPSNASLSIFILDWGSPVRADLNQKNARGNRIGGIMFV